MSDLNLRRNLNRPLTYNELDDNFEYLESISGIEYKERYNQVISFPKNYSYDAFKDAVDYNDMSYIEKFIFDYHTVNESEKVTIADTTNFLEKLYNNSNYFNIDGNHKDLTVKYTGGSGYVFKIFVDLKILIHYTGQLKFSNNFLNNLYLCVNNEHTIVGHDTSNFYMMSENYQDLQGNIQQFSSHMNIDTFISLNTNDTIFLYYKSQSADPLYFIYDFNISFMKIS